jgi:hypothetical protein
MLAWIALALLSASWLFGLDYYYHITSAWLLGPTLGAKLPDWLPWALLVSAGTLLLLSRADRMPGRKQSLLAALLASPAIFLAPWPYRAAPLLLTAGLLLGAAPETIPWLRRFGRAAAVAGSLLLVQALALTGYIAITARSHELPWPLPEIIGSVAQLLGAGIGVHGSTLAAFSMRESHMLVASWELLFDPPTMCFVAGGLVLLAWRAWTWLPRQQRGRYWLVGAAILAGLVALWAPFRASLLIGAYLHNVLRVDYDMPLDVMKLFWNPWVHLLLLAAPVLLAWRFLPLPQPKPEPVSSKRGAKSAPRAPAATTPSLRRCAAAALLVGGSVAMFTAAVVWDPPGRRLDGRVLIEEYHPQPDKIWERTDKPYDETWYGHLAGYNYYCIYDYLRHYYQASRLTKPIDDRALETCDVLILKVPTRRYSPQEIESVCRFVDRGGGLMLIGEHTNVFGTGTYLNEISRRFGFEYRYDCLFGMDSVFDQRLAMPIVPHPVLQSIPVFDFATSCSIQPISWSGQAVVRSTGLKNKMAEYHVENFYPPATDTAAMRYGAFEQLWSVRSGRGRVLAFTDSTVFSNFSSFEPGKAELMMGMVEWLNHANPPLNPRPWLSLLGVGLAAAGLWASRPWEGAWAVLVAAGLSGWTGASLAALAFHQAALPLPQPIRPLVQVVVDETLSGVQWPKNGFIGGKEGQYGIFERWILKLGYFSSRRHGVDALRGNLLVIVNPAKPVDPAFRDQMLRYVADGGKVLLLDSPENQKESTANELLQPLKLSVDWSRTYRGDLRSTQSWSKVPIETAVRVVGGKPFAWIDKTPIGATIAHGKGTVTVLGFGSRFDDTNMGVTGDVEPNDDQKKVYAVEFSLLRAIVEGKPLDQPPKPAAKPVANPPAKSVAKPEAKPAAKSR